MRRITARFGALVLMAGVLFGGAGTASAHVRSAPAPVCIGSSLALYNTTAFCIANRSHFPVISIIGG
ncbi:hypothetical protein SAMN04489730_3523 [Amycolatopsis australiensis]|uniref:Small secreted domain n=1 Tax=Amycolatopsis australiensis TaxID=546364 RepID=A0A1K1RM83_9PSEU|nr:hypothetical protein SAMN04489730_3523 [Amycolatopsis australiensis]